MQESKVILNPDNDSSGLISQNDCKHLCRHARPEITKLSAATESCTVFSICLHVFVCLCVSGCECVETMPEDHVCVNVRGQILST